MELSNERDLTIVQGLVLAAGIGYRLQPITNDIPKALVKVKSIPLGEIKVEVYI